ncbi:MAG: type IX secretion system anionic LPS delivery protein PorZ [Flavisolibacter sp.]
MRLIFLIVLFVSGNSIAQNTFPPVGMWREHLPYQGTIDVTASEKKIYAATEYSLFSIDITTKEIDRISKIAGLSETGISAVQFDPLSKKLFVAYTNSNIDVLDASGIHNIPDLKRRVISGDKNIYHIYTDNNLCYLSTGLGVIVIDADKFEIKDSWFIGNNGGYVKTNDFTKANNFFYAATEEGLKQTSASTNNPADFNNWQTVSGSNGLSSSSCKAVVNFQNKVIALQNDSLFVNNGSSWQLFFSNNWPILSINVSENDLVVCERKTSGEAQIVLLNTDGSVKKTMHQKDVISFPKKGISIQNECWLADLYGGLSHWANNSFETYKLNSPDNIAWGQLAVYDHVFYAAAGAANESWNYQYNPNGIYQLKNDYWTSYNQYHFQQLDSMLDFITVAIDPRDESIWAGSFGGGLMHVKSNDQIEIFKQNSPIEETVGDKGSYRIAGLAFDKDNNLWMSNFGANHQLHVKKNDGSWQSFSAPFLLNTNATTQIIIDDLNQKWIASPLGNGLIVFNDNNTIDNAADDKWKIYKAGAGQGNLPSNEVTCITKDKSGFIWAGTANGVAVIQCPQEAFSSSGCEALLPVIKEGGFANYLFKGEVVRSIAVDGADRKWMATADGAWLINADGDKVLMHFNEDNSPLLSSDVRNIAIDGKTGEVYFGTSKGICSFRSTATEVLEDKGNVLVFPNPVSPGYTGSIAVKGLPENSIVKITEMNGRLVYQSRSLGGQVIWNGKDYKGRRAATGIYLVIAEDDLKQEKAVAKIVFVAK